MAEVTDQKETYAMVEVAEALGITYDEVFDEVFSGAMPSIESPTGRRLVPRDVVDQRLRRLQGAA